MMGNQINALILVCQGYADIEVGITINSFPVQDYLYVLLLAEKSKISTKRKESFRTKKTAVGFVIASHPAECA